MTANAFYRLAMAGLGILGLGCASSRPYFLGSELPLLEGQDRLIVAPGPWEHEEVPAVYSDAPHVPDELVLSTLKALMALPGAAGTCNPNSGKAERLASEYCVALYRTPEDWRVSWPIRNMTHGTGKCDPPLGGVDDKDFGGDLPIFGFAHNHPCGTDVSSGDLKVFPAMKLSEGHWKMIEYAVTPTGRPARDARGQLIPAWGWLATGDLDAPRFYKWNFAGEVFRWREEKGQWEFQATCTPQQPDPRTGMPRLPKCSPK